jgi:hypothetical protein
MIIKLIVILIILFNFLNFKLLLLIVKLILTFYLLINLDFKPISLISNSLRIKLGFKILVKEPKQLFLLILRIRKKFKSVLDLIFGFHVITLKFDFLAMVLEQLIVLFKLIQLTFL